MGGMLFCPAAKQNVFAMTDMNFKKKGKVMKKEKQQKKVNKT